MNKLMMVGIAALAFGLSGAAQAQTASTTQTTMPDGSVRTTSRTDSAGGTAATHTIDRADGTRTVVRRQTDVNGNTRSVRHDRGSDMVRVCHSRWDHGQRVRRCHTRPRR